VDNAHCRLHELIDKKCVILRDEPVTLSNGALSHFYFDCKAVTLDGEALSLIADAFLAEIRELPVSPVAIGGLTMGADFITAAVAMKGFERGLGTIHGSIVRKEPKNHGTMNHIENELPVGTPIVVVDDVITTGSSTKLACEQFVDSGYKIVGIIALIDREQGGRETLERDYGPVRAIFKKSDFPKISAHEQTAVHRQAA